MKYKKLKVAALHEQPGTQGLSLIDGAKGLSVKMKGSMVHLLFEEPEEGDIREVMFHMIPDDGVVPLDAHYIGTFMGRSDTYHVFQS